MDTSKDYESIINLRVVNVPFYLKTDQSLNKIKVLTYNYFDAWKLL